MAAKPTATKDTAPTNGKTEKTYEAKTSAYLARTMATFYGRKVQPAPKEKR